MKYGLLILCLTAEVLARPALIVQPRVLHKSSSSIWAQAHDNWLFVPPLAVAPPPAGFDWLRVGNRPCHVPLERTPWRIDVGDGRFWPVLQQAMQTWNTGAQTLGMAELFSASDQQHPADITLKWFDPKLPADKAAATWWVTGINGTRVSGISLDGNFRVPQGNMAQILAHELGHVLGLGESQQAGDLMYYRTSNRPLRLHDVRLSQRDFETFRWLYAQEYFTPIYSPLDLTSL